MCDVKKIEVLQSHRFLASTDRSTQCWSWVVGRLAFNISRGDLISAVVSISFFLFSKITWFWSGHCCLRGCISLAFHSHWGLISYYCFNFS